MTRPNGIALSPDNRRLYVGESAHGNASWYTLEARGDGGWGPPQLFLNPAAAQAGLNISKPLVICWRCSHFRSRPGGTISPV
jgi:hypothetical protein